MKDLLIPHYLLECTPEIVSTYLTIKLIFGANDCEQNLLIPEAIALFQQGSYKPTRYTLDKIKETLKDLVRLELITPVGDYYLVSREQLSVTPPFTTIGAGVFKELSKDPKLLLHYLIIKKSRSYQIEVNGKNSVICCLPLEYFANQENVSKRTIVRYNQQLEDAKLIYIKRSQYKDGNESRELNVYSLYEDRSYADAYRPTSDKSNDRRKVAALYNAYCKHPEKYSAEEKESIRSMVEEYNAECLKMGELQPDYLKKIRDLDIFDLF